MTKGGVRTPRTPPLDPRLHIYTELPERKQINDICHSNIRKTAVVDLRLRYIPTGDRYTMTRVHSGTEVVVHSD